jgi:hypothetical protein
MRDPNQQQHRRALILKVGVVLLFTLVRVATIVVRNRFLGGETGLDASWLMGLPLYLQQGGWSGRDFHFTYGPVAQILGWIATSLTTSGSVFDAYRIIGALFCILTFAVLGAALLLHDRISWKHAALVCALVQALDMFSEIPSLRPALVLLGTAFVYRIVAASTVRRQFLWTGASGVLCFVSQLVTPEVAIIGAVVVVGTLLADFFFTRSRVNVTLAIVFLSILAFLNVGIAAVFKWSSPNYEGLFDYQHYVIATMRGYTNTMGFEWGLDKTSTNFFALFMAYTIAAAVIAGFRSSPLDRCLIVALMLAALMSLKTAFIRSDAGHIEHAVWPLIFVFFLLGKKQWQPRFGRVVWSLFAVGLLTVWPRADWNVFNFYDAVNGKVSIPAALGEIFSASIPPEAILRPTLLDAEFLARTSVPILPFPYENYIPALLKRPLLAPVLQSYSASTAALQRFYVDTVERQRASGGVDVVYGLDAIAAWPVDGVQAITRVPIIFEYFYRHFGLPPTEPHEDGHYILESRDHQRDLPLQDLPFADDRTDDAAGAVRLAQQSACGLVRLDLRMTYPWKKFFFRPSGIELFFRKGPDVVAVAAVRPTELDEFFTTYVSLLPPPAFYKLFQESIIPTAVWDNIVYRQAATDQLSARPRKVEIGRVQCVNSHTFAEGEPLWETSEPQTLFPAEMRSGTPRTGYAVVTPETPSLPELTARLGFAAGLRSQVDVPMKQATTTHHIRILSAVAKDVGIGIVNPQSKPIVVDIRYNDGKKLRSGTLEIQNGRHLSKFVPEILPLPAAEVLTGTIEFSSRSNFSVVALKLLGLSLEVFPIDEAAGQPPAGAGPVVFPQFVMQGGWATAFSLVNRSESQAEGRIDIFSSSGQPMAVTLNGHTSSTHKYSVPPGNVWRLWPGGMPVDATK